MAAIEPVQIAASILSADLSRLREQVEEAMNAGIRLIHVDVMDGLFGQGQLRRYFLRFSTNCSTPFAQSATIFSGVAPSPIAFRKLFVPASSSNPLWWENEPRSSLDNISYKVQRRWTPVIGVTPIWGTTTIRAFWGHKEFLA